MGKRKLLTKKDIKFLKKHLELIPLILGLSFIIMGSYDYGLGSGILYSVMGYLLLIITILISYKKYAEKRLHEIRKKQVILKRRMNQIDSIDPWDFEKLIAESLENVGFNAYATSGSGDKGIDVIAKKDSYTIVVQVKKYAGSVGFDAIKEAHTGLSLYNADEAWVVTSSNRFTKQAKETAEKLKVKLFTWGDFGLFLEKQERNIANKKRS